MRYERNFEKKGKACEYRFRSADFFWFRVLRVDKFSRHAGWPAIPSRAFERGEEIERGERGWVERYWVWALWTYR